jgi:hypothetical protein
MSAMAMPLPTNSLSMRSAEGRFSPIDMVGMFTVLEVRERGEQGRTRVGLPGPGAAVAGPATAAKLAEDGIAVAPAR